MLEKLEQLINLNPNQDQADTKFLEVSRRICDLESRIKRAKMLLLIVDSLRM